MKDANKRFSLVDYVKIYEPSGGPVQDLISSFIDDLDRSAKSWM